MKSSVFIIAEIGVNHNGSITLAKKLIKQLSKLDINAVKIQSYSIDNLVSKKSILADYQKEGNFEYSNQYEMLKKYEFGYDSHGKINLIDEIHTPDSSRYFYKNSYAELQNKGLKQKQLSKEFFREWLMKNNFQ